MRGSLNRNEILKLFTCSWDVSMIIIIKFIVFLVQKLYNQITAKITQRPLVFMCQWYGHQTFKFFDLNENFPKFTQRTSYQSWFNYFSFLCLQITAEIWKIKKCTQRNLMFWIELNWITLFHADKKIHAVSLDPMTKSISN